MKQLDSLENKQVTINCDNYAKYLHGTGEKANNFFFFLTEAQLIHSIMSVSGE